MSYTHIDDEYGHLTGFRKRLSHEVQMQTGEEFPIFQDRQDILWGQNWKERIEESLDEVTFLIPIITPSFFNSQPCRDELQRFIEREEKLKRNDLILPVYYIGCSLLHDEARWVTDKLAQVIAARQWADWRHLRHYSWDSQQVRKALERLAVQIRDALERVKAPPRTAMPGSTPVPLSDSVVLSKESADIILLPEEITPAERPAPVLEINQWLETNDKNIRIGLCFPTNMEIVRQTPIPAFGQIVGLPAGADYWIVGYVITDREYEQGGSDIDQDGYWKIDAIHLGAVTHRLFFRVFGGTGRMIVKSKEIRILKR